MTTPARLPRVRASELVGRGWLNTGGRALRLADLRGKAVVLDFWTFCCVNCLHVLDELRDLEARHRDTLVIIGVHSPKFAHEADPEALAAAVERYEVHHPVLDDPELVTWQAYTARAWPTLVVVDPEGYVVAQLAGEGHGPGIAALVEELVAEHEAAGTLHRGDGPYVPSAPRPTALRFPAKAVALADGSLLVADAGHHQVVHLAADATTVLRRVGSGERGLVDGGPDRARFAEPNGLCLVPGPLRDVLGADVLVADTANHVLRGVRLVDDAGDGAGGVTDGGSAVTGDDAAGGVGAVTTVAGTGEQLVVGGVDNVLDAGAVGGRRAWRPGEEVAATAVRLSSPWDVVWWPARGTFVVAMAGSHTLWELDPGTAPGAAVVRRLAGTMNEGLVDGPGEQAWFAQPSGLAVAADGGLWVADSETSALRHVVAVPGGGVEVRTAVGTGLFDFGHVDGPAAEARLQHPLGVAVLADGSVAIADTYNGAIRRYDPATGEVTTLARDLAEPSGLVVGAGATGAGAAGGEVADSSAETTVLVVESAAHRLVRVPLPAGSRVDAGARRTRRPLTDLGTSVTLDVLFTPAPGKKVDDRWGPATRLQVSATPPELLVDGAGDDTDLRRGLRLDPAVGSGVLHVTAHAASCDADPAVEFPACHLAQQDWGIPVRVSADGPAELVLPLSG